MSNLSKLKDLSQFILYDSLRAQMPTEQYYPTSIAIAYVYHKALTHFGDEAFNFDLELTLRLIKDSEIKSFLLRKLEGIDFSKASSAFLLVGLEGLEEYILTAENDINYSIYPTTVNSVLTIANKILSIDDGQKVFSSGQDLGSFIYNPQNKDKEIKYTFVEINVDSAAIAKIKLEILKKQNGYKKVNSTVVNENLLSVDINNQFDKAFLHMPFNIRVSGYVYDEYKETTPILNAFKKPISLDWPFMLKLSQSLKKGGKAVSLAFMGTTYNLNDREFRKYFVEKGLIEAVIALPGKLLNETSVQTALYVFSHNNSSIKFVDATEICEVGRRQNILNEENIETILSAYQEEVEGISKDVSIDEIADNEFALIPSRYLSSIKYANGVAFKEIISIRRGATLRADALDELSTIDHTDFQYLMLSDITDGIISDDLSFITHIDDSLSKFIIKEDNLVLSKIGAPFKVAIMNKRETEIIANGNLYILEVDETKVDPYYLQAFLQSDEGQKLLASVATGATFASISIKDLSDLEIPLPPLPEQKLKGKVYKEALNDIVGLTTKLEKTKIKIASLFDEKWNKKDVK